MIMVVQYWKFSVKVPLFKLLPCSSLLTLSKLGLFSGENEFSFTGDLEGLGDFKYLLSKGDAISGVT